MESGGIYENVKHRDVQKTTKPQSHSQDEGKDLKHIGSRCLVLITVSLALICVLLLVFIILQQTTITAERDLIKSYKSTVEEFNQTINRYKNLCGPVCYFIANELKSWSDSRQYCRDHGADLVIINTEEKQRFISSYMKDVDRAWIGLSDREQEGNMTWVNNSTLNQGFWMEGEPNNHGGVDEDCIEMRLSKDKLNNWNDLPCSIQRKGICEK
ncbi:CD209 antigen-like protein C [Carassius auratus]|uniref:CD209 antigen-like protein C n=1 Tax=Carassius auratus TaxID=7957 RepID=A0A6P6P689_CARAU|nr:CD209 antigen-like protein C [Carassius auratus]